MLFDNAILDNKGEKDFIIFRYSASCVYPISL